MSPSSRVSDHRPGVSSFPELHIADRLEVLNHNLRIETPGFHIDPGAMLCLAVGNPAHFRFAIEGREGDLTFRVSQLEEVVASGRLYRDPLRGGGYFYPEVSESYRGLGLGILCYLTAGRIAKLLWREDLHSNQQQLSPSAEAVWKTLANQGLGIQRGLKEFSLRSAVGESEGAAMLLGTLLKMRSNEALYAQSPHAKLPPVPGEALREMFDGDLRPYDYWLHTNASLARVRKGS